MRTVLFGGTDLTLAVARHIADRLVGVVIVPSTFAISYKPGGMANLRYADVGSWATSRGLPTHEWQGVDACADFVAPLGAEWAIAAGWYHLLPRRLLDAFPRGIAGVHASLLPRYRGNAPLNWAILNGETETGVSMFRMTAGVDDGDLYGQLPIRIGPRTTIGELVAEAQTATLQLIDAAVASEARILQPQTGEPTYCLPRTSAHGQVDWSRPAESIDRLVRATSRPYGGAFTTFGVERITIWCSELPDVTVSGTPGQIWRKPDGGVAVVCGSGVLELIEATTSDDEDARCPYCGAQLGVSYQTPRSHFQADLFGGGCGVHAEPM